MECVSEMGLIGSNDVVVANAGVHHNDVRTLKANVIHFLSWWQQTAARPCVLWRQTLPQHFDTANGTYSPVASLTSKERLWLVKDWKFEAFREIHHSPNCCKPVHQPSQKFGATADPLIAQAGIPIIDLYQVGAPLWWAHTGCVRGKQRA